MQLYAQGCSINAVPGRSRCSTVRREVFREVPGKPAVCSLKLPPEDLQGAKSTVNLSHLVPGGHSVRAAFDVATPCLSTVVFLWQGW